MKILVVTQYFYPETFRVNSLCVELVNRGHKVTVLTGYPQYPKGKIYDGYGFYKDYEHEWRGVTIERMKVLPRGKTPIGLLFNCLTFVAEGKKWVKRCAEKFDAVYVFEVSPVTVGLPAVEYKKKFGTPVFFNVQDLWPENVEEVLGIHNKLVIDVINKIVDKIYRESDKILCSSNGFVDNIANRGVPMEKLVFWPQFCEEPKTEGVSKPGCYDDSYFNIVFAGNIGDAQGLDLLVKVAEQLRDEKIRWYLVGNGRARKKLQNLVESKQLKKNIVFVGKVNEEEANRYVSFADCAYLSFKDSKLFDLTIPAKLQTYLACGTPIIGAVGGESATIIREGKCGITASKNIESVKEAVMTMYALSNEERKMMGENGKAFFHRMFEKDTLISVLVDNILFAETN